MKQISDMEYEKYQQYQTEKLHGRILTPDGLRVVCAGLDNDPEKLKAEGYTEDQIARAMHEKRRELGRQYKEAAPPLFRAYIYEAAAAKYGDPLGPVYEMLREKKTCKQIIESASQPIEDLDNRLTLEGFQQWYVTHKNRLPY